MNLKVCIHNSVNISMPFDVYFCMCVGLYLYLKTNNVSIFAGRPLMQGFKVFQGDVSKELKLEKVLKTNNFIYCILALH